MFCLKYITLIVGLCFAWLTTHATTLTELSEPSASFRTTGFQKNHGQILNQDGIPNNDVLYLLELDGYNVHITKHGFSYELVSRMTSDDDSPKYLLERIDYEFVNATQSFQIIPSNKKVDICYKYSHNSNEYVSIEHFNTIRINNVSPGIDVIYELIEESSGAARFKYSVVAKSIYELNNFKIRINGSNDIKSNQNQIQINLPSSSAIIEKIPQSWVSFDNSTSVFVDGTYALKDGVMNFCVPSFSYDREDYIITIDPTPNIVWGTYYGGTSTDASGEMAWSTTGLYLVGQTSSTGSIASSGSHQSTLAGSLDACLIKLSTSGTRLWATYYGGSSDDRGFGVTVDGNGDVYICGLTFSTSGIATSGSHQSTLLGTENSFIAKFNSSGVRQWGSYYGNTGVHNRGSSVITDPSNNVYLCGDTYSTVGISTSGSHQSTIGGMSDLYLAKFTSAGVRIWGTYYGGSEMEDGSSMGIDSNGNIYMTGSTRSTSGISTTGCHQPTFAGGLRDGLLVKFNSSGTRLWATYYGGSDLDNLGSPDVDCNNNIYCTGGTKSSSGIATTGSYQSSIGGSTDAFVVRFNSSGVRSWGTYLGGTGIDSGTDVETYGADRLFLCGATLSYTSIATPGAYQPYHDAQEDLFLAHFQSNGTLLWSTYFGGNGQDQGGSLVATSGNIYLAGYTGSTSGISTSGSYQSSNNGDFDIMVARFSTSLPVACEPRFMLAEDSQDRSCPFVDGISVSRNQLLEFVGNQSHHFRTIELYNMSGQPLSQMNLTNDNYPHVLMIVTETQARVRCSSRVLLIPY